VEQKYGVVDAAGGVAMRSAKCEVVQLECEEGLAGAEAEVRQGDAAVDSGPGDGWRGGCLRCGGLAEGE
jgi:hypothetical protein